MPGRDHTGPLGAGPRTGRGMGYCGYSDRGAYASLAPGTRDGFGFGCWGMGHGWRHRFYATGVPGWATATPEQETVDLNAQLNWLKGQLEVIEKRIEELTAK